MDSESWILFHHNFHLSTVFAMQTCRDAEKAAEVARAKYDEARAQRELAEQKTAEHKQLEAEHSAIQHRLHDADAQLASMSGDVEQQVCALDEAHTTREQQTGRLREAEEEVERIERQLAQAQEVVAQLKQDVDAITVSDFAFCTYKCRLLMNTVALCYLYSH